MKFYIPLLLAPLNPIDAFVEPESSFGTLLIEAANVTKEDTGTAFFFADEIPNESTANLFHHLDFSGATFDARSGKVANIDLSVPILPGDGNNLLWSVGFADSSAGKPEDDSEWQVVGASVLQDWINSHQDELSIDASELFVSNAVDAENGEDAAVRSAVHGDGDMIQFSLQRTFKGVVVRGSRAIATIKAGNLVNVGFELWSDIPSDFEVFPRITANEAYQILARRTGYQLKKERSCEPELQILTQAAGEVPILNTKGLRANSSFKQTVPELGQGYTTSLVWKVCPTFEGQTIEEFEALVDARTSAIYSLRDTVEYYQAKGDVYPLSNDGQDKNGQLQLDWPMPFAQVGSEITDTGGNYFNEGTVTAYLRGPFANMYDFCGAEALIGSKGVDWGGYGARGDCGNPGYGNRGNTHASRSGFYELNKIMEIARSHLPSNSWLKRQLFAVMNINNSCNAYWNGRNIYFYRSGNGCGNTGEITAVVDHEWGHGMDSFDVAGGISQPSGEGIADIYAALRLNDSCIGRGFWQKQTCSGNGNACISCTGVRDIDYLKRENQSPTTYSWAKKECGNSEHCWGYVYSEAIWSLYKRHLQSPPYNYDENTALEITMRLTFIGAGNVQTWFEGSGGCGSSSGYRQFLLADDDNGNVNDGTPHMSAIYNAFNDQEIACKSPTVQDSGCFGNPNQAPIVTASPGDMKATLTWNLVLSASNYEVFRTEGVNGCSQGKVKLATLSSNDSSFTDTGLQNGREYYYIVIPKGPNAACFGPSSQCVTVVPSNVATSSPSSAPTPKPNIPGPTTPTSPTTCGNGICELMKNETPLTCPNDCITKDLALASSPNAASKAVMFTATPVKDVSFTSIGIVGKKSRYSLVQVYTRTGSYNGSEESASGWELCFNSVILLQQGAPVSVDLACSTYTPAGSSRSFHVYVKAGMSIMSGNSGSSNNLLKVGNSITMKDLFNKVLAPALMTGSLRFYQVSSSPTQTETSPATSRPSQNPTPSTGNNACGDGVCSTRQTENPGTCPVDCPVQSLQLTTSITAVSKGAMFMITAIESITFTSLSVMTGKNSGMYPVEIYTLVGDYTGNEKNPAAWTLCFSADVLLQQDKATAIKGLNCDTSTPAGSKRSFHIFAEKAPIYFEKGAPAASSAMIKVDKGVFTKNKFDKPKGDGLMYGEVAFFKVSP